MKKFMSLFLGAVFLCMLCGCAAFSGGAKSDPDTSLTIKKDGTLLSVIKESFNESNYSIDELKSDIEAETLEFNEKGTESVTLNKAELSDGATDVELTFSSDRAYADFNSEVLSIASADDYLSGGRIYDREAGDGFTSYLEDAKDSDATVLVAQSSDRIYLPGKVLYASDNTNVSESGTSVKKKEDSDGLIFVIYK